MAADGAEHIESTPPQESPKRPRDAAHADRTAVRWDVLHWFVLVVTNDVIDVLKAALLGARNMGVEDDPVLLQLAIDIQGDNVDSVLVEPGPGELHVRGAQQRSVRRHHG